MLRALLSVSLLLAACGDSGTGPGGHTLAVGTYTYSMTDPRLGGPTYTGHLVITAATPEQLTGSWDVPGYQPALLVGGWNVDAYIPMANKVGGGSVTHRIWRSGSGVQCTASIIDPVSTPAACTLTAP